MKKSYVFFVLSALIVQSALHGVMKELRLPDGRVEQIDLSQKEVMTQDTFVNLIQEKSSQKLKNLLLTFKRSNISWQPQTKNLLLCRCRG